MKVALAVVGALVVMAGIVVGGWDLGWFAASSATNHQNHIYQQSYGTQTAEIEQVRTDLTTIDQIDVQLADRATPASEQSALAAQKVAVTNQACGVAMNITSPPADVSAFRSTNCQEAP